jgi:hypothetical protein
MSFYVKLSVFCTLVYSAIWLFSRFPNSHISRIAFSWHGPIPKFGELKSHYLLRWCLYALGWLAQVAFLFACGYFAVWVHPPLAETVPFLVFWAFALPLFGGIALLGALIAAASALKAKAIGPNPTFEPLDHEHLA